MHLQRDDRNSSVYFTELIFAVLMTRWGENVPTCGNPWGQAVAGGILVQRIPVKVHHALNFSTKRKWGAKNKVNFTAPEPCDYRRLLVSRQSGPFCSPGYLCSSNVCKWVHIWNQGKKKTLKDNSTLALLRFSGVSEAAGLQLHRLRSMQCESAGNFNLGIICACSRWLHLVFAQVSFYCSTATSEQLALFSAQKEHRAKSCVKGTLGWPLHCQTSPEFFTKIVLICTLCILGGGLVFDWWLFPFTALVGIFGASLPCCHAPAWKICPVNLFCTLLPPLYFSEDTSHMWSCCAE